MYYELNIYTDQINTESVYAIIYKHNISGILEEDRLIKIYFKKNEKKKIDKIKQELSEILNLPESNISSVSLSNMDWNKEWRNSIEPVYIKDKIIIYPSWKKNQFKKIKDKIKIELDPKMSFGTGHSETTQVILELMCDYIDKNDKYLLDYGCGTAILAIGGVKLGIKKAVAIDINEDAIMNANESIKKNRVSKNIVLHKADITKISETDFDIIVCNINLPVISKNIKKIKSKLAENGKLFITGILNSEENEIIQLLKSNKFELIETRSKAEWLSFYAYNI